MKKIKTIITQKKNKNSNVYSVRYTSYDDVFFFVDRVEI